MVAIKPITKYSALNVNEFAVYIINAHGINNNANTIEYKYENPFFLVSNKLYIKT